MHANAARTYRRVHLESASPAEPAATRAAAGPLGFSARHVHGYVTLRARMPRPVANPPNPWLSTHVEYIDDIPDARLEVFEEDARTILAENDSPDIPFRWGVNPYRGCYHGCAYCYARPTHEYLGWGAGTDFERKIIIKRNAPQLLRTAFLRRGWQGERIAFSGVTDCYQPLEAAYKLTRGCLEVCLEFRNPVHVITKSALVARDADLLARLSRDADAVAILSIPFADDETGRQIEPYASRITKRFAALEQLSAAGVRTAVAVAPVIPGLNDRHIPEILTRARACGATRAFMTMVRLTKSVLPVFEQRLTEAVPLRATLLSDAEALCSRVAILAKGALLTTGRLTDMLAFQIRGWEVVASGVHADLSWLPGDLAMFDRMTGAEHVEMVAAICGADTSPAAPLFERFGLDPTGPVGTLSRGNRQKVGLVLAFFRRPRVIVLDEPSSGLDPLMQREFHALVHETVADGSTVMVSFSRSRSAMRDT